MTTERRTGVPCMLPIRPTAPFVVIGQVVPLSGEAPAHHFPFEASFRLASEIASS